MGHDQLFDALLLLALLWLCLLLYWAWRRAQLAMDRSPSTAATPITKRSRDPKPFPGLIHKPYCDTCMHVAEPCPQAPSAPPPLLLCRRGRRRTVDTRHQFCPDEDCF